MTAETAAARPASHEATVGTTRAPGQPKSRSWLVRGLVLVIALAWTTPTAGLLISSLRNEVSVSSTGWWTVFVNPFDFTQYTLANYDRVLTAEGLFDAFINTLIVTIPATVIPITLAAFAAYGFAWTKFRGRSFLFAVVVGLLVIPLQMSLVPLLRIYGNLTWSGASSVSGWPTPGSGCHLPSISSTTTYPNSPRTSSSRLTSMGLHRLRPSPAWCCLCPSRPWPRSPSFNSSGFGTIFWSRSSSSAPTLTSAFSPSD